MRYVALVLRRDLELYCATMYIELNIYKVAVITAMQVGCNEVHFVVCSE